MVNAFWEWCDRFWWGVRLVSLLTALAVLVLITVFHEHLGSGNAAAWAKWGVVIIILLVAVRVGIHRGHKP